MLSNGTNGGETSKYIQDAYALQAKIVLAIYSLSLIFSVFSFVSAASPLVSVFLFAETLPKGFILSSLWFLTTEVFLFNNYNSFQDLLNDESTPNKGALKLTTTTASIMKYVTMYILKTH